MKKITQAAELLVASHQMARPLNVYVKRIGRIKDRAADEVYNRLTARQKPSGIVYANLDWEDKMTARGLRLGVEEFKKKHPKYAKELESIIKHQRKCKRTYVEFGSYDDLPDDLYLQVLRNVGIPQSAEKSTLKTIKRISSYLDDDENRILVD